MPNGRSEVAHIKVKLKKPNQPDKDIDLADAEHKDTIGAFWGEAGKNMLVEYYRLKGQGTKADEVEAAWNTGQPILFSKEVTCENTPEP